LTRAEHAPADRRRLSLLGGACGSKIELSAAFWGGVQCASPPQAQWRGACAEVAQEGAPTGVFSLPISS